MSWDAVLVDDRGHTEGKWNSTHNTNQMANVALGVDSWWRELNGKTGLEGAAFLDRAIKALESDPATFRAMNPPNGWGSYEGLLSVLKSMRGRVPEWPTKWDVRG